MFPRNKNKFNFVIIFIIDHTKHCYKVKLARLLNVIYIVCRMFLVLLCFSFLKTETVEFTLNFNRQQACKTKRPLAGATIQPGPRTQLVPSLCNFFRECCQVPYLIRRQENIPFTPWYASNHCRVLIFTKVEGVFRKI